MNRTWHEFWLLTWLLLYIFPFAIILSKSVFFAHFQCLYWTKAKNTRASQKFCDILVVCASLWCIYHVTEAVQATKGTHCGY